MIWGKVILYKYVCCWLIAVSLEADVAYKITLKIEFVLSRQLNPCFSLQEGVCILIGLGYNGKNEKGIPKWDACANMKVWLYETTPYFTGTIASFNINTNAWVAR